MPGAGAWLGAVVSAHTARCLLMLLTGPGACGLREMFLWTEQTGAPAFYFLRQGKARFEVCFCGEVCGSTAGSSRAGECKPAAPAPQDVYPGLFGTVLSLLPGH